MQNKIAIVTGAAKRIGKEIVKHLIQKKWHIIIHYNQSENEAKILQDSLPKNCSHIIQADFSKTLDEKKFFNEILSLTNGHTPELLINNASSFKNETITTLTTESLIEELQINCISPLLLSIEFARHTQQGNIINILDFYAIEHHKNFAAHQISKTALLKATKQMALEFAPAIRANGITPSFVMKSILQTTENFDNHIKNSLFNKAVDTSDICNAIDFILNTKSVTGQNIILDCGRKLIT